MNDKCRVPVIFVVSDDKGPGPTTPTRFPVPRTDGRSSLGGAEGGVSQQVLDLDGLLRTQSRL